MSLIECNNYYVYIYHIIITGYHLSVLSRLLQRPTAPLSSSYRPRLRSCYHINKSRAYWHCGGDIFPPYGQEYYHYTLPYILVVNYLAIIINNIIVLLLDYVIISSSCDDQMTNPSIYIY